MPPSKRHLFFPVAVETSGVWGRTVYDGFRQIGTRITATTGEKGRHLFSSKGWASRCREAMSHRSWVPCPKEKTFKGDFPTHYQDPLRARNNQSPQDVLSIFILYFCMTWIILSAHKQTCNKKKVWNIAISNKFECQAKTKLSTLLNHSSHDSKTIRIIFYNTQRLVAAAGEIEKTKKERNKVSSYLSAFIPFLLRAIQSKNGERRGRGGTKKKVGSTTDFHHSCNSPTYYTKKYALLGRV